MPPYNRTSQPQPKITQPQKTAVTKPSARPPLADGSPRRNHRRANPDNKYGTNAESVDNVIMTDHHHHTDLRPRIDALGFTAFVTATIGEEITTWDAGHYNAYPLLIDPTRPSGGSTDWGGAAPAGEDFPSLGHFILTNDHARQLTAQFLKPLVHAVHSFRNVLRRFEDLFF